MWQDTKDGLYKRFNFTDFNEAWGFMQQVAAKAQQLNHHPRWQNDWNIVDIWLCTHEKELTITEQDKQFADIIDNFYTAYNKSQLAENVAIKTTSITEVKLFTDGGSRGNPGPAATGFVISDINDKVVKNTGTYLGITTNNKAEYTALLEGLTAANNLGAKQVNVYMDSLLIVNQMNGVFKIKSNDLLPIYGQIKQLVILFDKVTFTHVPREMNKAADAEVNKVLDANT